MSNKQRIHLNTASRISGSEYYRTYLPYRHCAKALAQEDIELTLGPEIGTNEVIEAIYVRFIVEPMVLMHYLDRQRRGFKIAYDVDDLLMNVPRENGVNVTDRQKEWIACTSRFCDLLTVSTQTLATEFCLDTDRPMVKPWRVCPNLIDLNDWGWLNRATGEIGFQPTDDTSQIRIAWAGSNTHDHDLAMIDTAIERIVERYGADVTIYVMGDAPPAWLAYGFPKVREQPYVPLEQYPDALQSIRPHIGLCPLVESRFASSKSCCKWMEYTASGATVLASSGGVWSTPYDALPSNALVKVANDQDAWFEALCRMIEDHQARQAMWTEAARHLVENWSWQRMKNRDAWMRSFRFLAGR